MGLVPIMRELGEEQINPVPKAELGGVTELAEAEVLHAVVDRERRIFDEALGLIVRGQAELLHVVLERLAAAG